MALLWICHLMVLVHAVNGASIVERSARSGKKIIRHGDELFLVDVVEDNYHNHHNHHHSQHKRSIKDDQGRRIIRIGDELIVLKDDDDKDNSGSHNGNGIHRRAAVKDEAYRWTDKTVPYLFDSTFGADDQAIVKSAMDEWSRHTCVVFRPARSSDANKVKFVQGDGCYSFVGMVEKTQDISLDKNGCRLVSTVLHEIGHALGMYHTQGRPDRDQYIKINTSDVDEDLQGNFEKQTWENAHHYGVNYDFKSIMHYDGTSFTSNGGTSIKTLDPKWQKIIGNVKHLSFGDIEMMNKMYRCAPETCKLKDSDCPGTSFVDQTCKCVCPGPSSDNPVVPCSGSGPNTNGQIDKGHNNDNNDNNNNNNNNSDNNHNNNNNNSDNNHNNNNNKGSQSSKGVDENGNWEDDGWNDEDSWVDSRGDNDGHGHGDNGWDGDEWVDDTGNDDGYGHVDDDWDQFY